MVVPLAASKLAKAVATSEPSALVTTRSDKGVTLVRPLSVAMLCSVVSPLTTCSIQGIACPLLSTSVYVPSAAVVPVTTEPEMHLAVTEAPAKAAPVAAKPVIW